MNHFKPAVYYYSWIYIFLYPNSELLIIKLWDFHLLLSMECFVVKRFYENNDLTFHWCSLSILLLLEDISSQNTANIMPQDCGTDVLCYEAHAPMNCLCQSHTLTVCYVTFVCPYMDMRKSRCWSFFFASSSPYSCTVKKNMQRHGSFIHFALLKLTVPGLWRLIFRGLSRQISFSTFVEL